MPLDEHQLHALKFQIQMSSSTGALTSKSELFDYTTPNDKINFNLSEFALLLLNVAKPMAYPYDRSIWSVPITDRFFDRFRCWAAELFETPEIEAIINGQSAYKGPRTDDEASKIMFDINVPCVQPEMFAFDEDYKTESDENQVVPQPSLSQQQNPEIRKVIAIRPSPPASVEDALNGNSLKNGNSGETSTTKTYDRNHNSPQQPKSE